jgi:hypothetical protein
MKKDNTTNFRDIYLAWLKENIEQFQISENIFRITLPFLDRDNDFIEVYIVKEDENSFYITDDGAIINGLELSGFNIFGSPKRRIILNSIVASYGVSVTQDNELTVNCSFDNLALKKHMLTQCMLKVNDMFQLSKNNVQSLFLEDVQSFLDINDIRYTENVSFTGKSTLPTQFDFVIPRSKKAPERLIKVVNHMDETAVKNTIFSWDDTKEVRSIGTQLYTFIQDSKKIHPDAIGALLQYKIKPILWSQKDTAISDLVA